MSLLGERPITREKAIEIAQICHGLSLEDATKYINTLLARGDRQIRFHYELVDIENPEEVDMSLPDKTEERWKKLLDEGPLTAPPFVDTEMCAKLLANQERFNRKDGFKRNKLGDRQDD